MKPNKNIDDKLAYEFYRAITTIKTVEEARNFLNDLCTPAELQALVDRWAVVPDLIEGKPYRTIHEETGVSVTTIGRVARSLNFGSGGYKQIFERLKNEVD